MRDHGAAAAAKDFQVPSMPYEFKPGAMFRLLLATLMMQARAGALDWAGCLKAGAGPAMLSMGGLQSQSMLQLEIDIQRMSSSMAADEAVFSRSHERMLEYSTVPSATISA